MFTFMSGKWDREQTAPVIWRLSRRAGFQMSPCKTANRKTTARAAMLRRGRNGGARHLAWSEPQLEADAVAAIQTSDGDGQTAAQEVGDMDADCPDGGHTISEAAALPGTEPVTGESFCHCAGQEGVGPGFSATSDCLCGEEDQDFEWVWDEHFKSTGVFLSCDSRKVSFHSDYSCGTAAIRGTKELADGQHYWEVKMTSPVYGTDMMVGIGTAEMNLDTFRYSFGSLLGHDEDSWGLSYTGLLQHKGDKVKFFSRFGEGSIIGVHLDTWHGTLTFYKNRRCIGVAATRLQNKKFYPMVCSTAAKSSMKVIRACSAPTTLQYLCCARLRQTLPSCPDVLNAVPLPPGLRLLLRLNLGWVFTLSGGHDASGRAISPPSSPVPSPASTLSASPSPSPLPFSDAVSYHRCPCQLSPHSGACRCPPTPPSSDYDSCCSEPEDYQCKRCRWT